MDALVLVGGEGTRMRPLTYDTPKPMLPVLDRPLIEHVGAWLSLHGVSRLVLSLGYRPDSFQEAYPDGDLAGLELVCAVEPELLDTAGAVRFAAAEAGVKERFVVLNGDVLTDFDLSALITFHEARQASASIGLTPVEDPSQFGVVPTDAEGRVMAFIEKPAPDTAPTNLINAGIYVVEPEVLDRIPGGRRVSIERETFPGLVADGTLYALASEEYWIDTGTPAKYLEAQLDILRHARSAAEGPAATEAEPGVHLAEGCRVDGRLEAVCYVGPEAVVGGGADVGDSVVGAGARVGEGAVVRGSALLPGAVVGAGATVEQSILGPGAVVGEGANVSGLSVLRGGCEVPAGAELAGARYPVS